MSDDPKTDGDRGSSATRRTLLLVALAIAAVLFVLAWLLLPMWDFLVEPIAPDVRADIAQAIEAVTDPAEQARLRLELAALEQEDAARRSGLRSTIAQVATALLAGSAAAWGAVAAWRQLQDNRRQAEATRKETDEQLRIARDGQLTERFTRAVEQLGNENLDVRLGGIYALGRIANDSQTDLPTVVEVLAAFVRGRSSLLESTDGDESAATPTDDDGESEPLSRRAADVQAALTVLGRIEREPGSVVDLSATDLAGADLTEANLSDADLRGVDLTLADLDRANLNSANLTDAQFTQAALRRADLTGADLTRADFADAHLAGAQLVTVTLWGTDFTGADLRHASLRMAHLFVLPPSIVDFRGTHSTNVDLLRPNLTCADLRGADLTSADLAGASLRGADLRDAHVSGAKLDSVQGDSETKWPVGFDPEAAGVIFVDHEESPDEPEPDAAQ